MTGQNRVNIQTKIRPSRDTIAAIYAKTLLYTGRKDISRAVQKKTPIEETPITHCSFVVQKTVSEVAVQPVVACGEALHFEWGVGRAEPRHVPLAREFSRYVV